MQPSFASLLALAALSFNLLALSGTVVDSLRCFTASVSRPLALYDGHGADTRYPLAARVHHTRRETSSRASAWFAGGHLATLAAICVGGMMPKRRRATSVTAEATPQVVAVEFPECLSEIVEQKALDAASRYSQVSLNMPSEFADAPVGASFIGPSKPLLQQSSDEAPVVILHGFDSSALEFRRLVPEMEERDVAVHYLDVLGWGFADISGVRDFSPEAKRAHIYAFWKQHLGGRPMVLGGASLGGGIAIDFAVAHPEAVERLVLINPQAYIDGAPKVGPLGPLGIQLLSSWPLRWFATQLAYFDKEKYGTDDSVRIGRLHVRTKSWESASLNYLNSGGYTLSPLVPQVRVPTLLLWGEEDTILDSDEQVPRFKEDIQGPVQFELIPNCGHVPHLEKPTQTADVLTKWLRSEK